MYKDIFQLIVFFFLSTFTLNAQYISCEDSELEALCDLNDIDGTLFTSPDPGIFNVPSEAICYDGGAFNNPRWFSFVAGSASIELLLTPLPMTCDTTIEGLTGIQVALWQGCPVAIG